MALCKMFYYCKRSQRLTSIFNIQITVNMNDSRSSFKTELNLVVSLLVLTLNVDESS
jgi:hypothetical protein